MQSVDRRGMLRLINELPEQCETALGIGRGFPVEPLSEPPNVVLICGAGDSGLAADMAAEIVADEIAVPVLVQHAGRIPNCVGEQAVVFIVDYSGKSQTALRSYRDARARGANVICVTGGGKLREIAAADGTKMVRIPGGQPSRSAIGYLFVPLVAVMEKLGLVSRATEDISNAIKLMKNIRESFRIETATARNLAKQVAESLAGKAPVICGAAGSRELVAVRWKNQIGANSKSAAMVCVFPDTTDGPISAWDSPDEHARGPRFVFLTEAADKATDIRLLMSTAEELLDRFGVIEIEMRGATAAERMLYGIYLGDYVSYYLALLYDVDPTQSESVTYINEQLAAAARPPSPPADASDAEPASEEETLAE
jgi:glucose/mannose-6-phosphate isomerase